MVVNHGKNAILTLDQCRAALDPVAAVVIRDVAKLADGRAMNVAAEHGIHTVAFRVTRYGAFEFTNEANRVFYTPLGIAAERPVTETESAPDKIDQRIQR